MTTMNKTELKKTVTKIKKFLKQRDYAAIDTGVELARGLGEPAVFEALLEDCAIAEHLRVDDRGKYQWSSHWRALDPKSQPNGLVRSRAFSGSGPAQPYLDYALLSLIAYAPEGTKVHASLVRSNIMSLSLRGGSKTELPRVLERFENLTSLDLRECQALQNVDGLANCTQLTSLDLSSCKSLQNVDGLANCTQLTSLDLSSCKALQNVDGLANCTQLTSLDLWGCNALQNVDGLANCTQLTSLYLNECKALQNVDVLANLTQLTSLKLSGCKALQNVDVLANLTQLTSLELRECKALQNVEVLANCTQLTSLSLTSCKVLQNVDGLANCTQLANLDLRYCSKVNPEPLPYRHSMSTREEVAAYQELIKKKMKETEVPVEKQQQPSLEERIAEMANADAALPLGDSQVMGDKKDTYFAYKSDSNGRERAAKGAEQMGLSQEAPMTEIYESVIERAIEEYKPIVKQRLKDLGVGPGQELIVLAMRCHPMS